MTKLKSSILLFTVFLLPSFIQAQPPVTKGLNKLHFKDGQRYYLYVPEIALDNAGRSRLLVSIHGYSGSENTLQGIARVKRAATRWEKVAEEKNIVVLAPHFDAKRFGNNYQRLNLRGIRSDQRLNELVNIVKTLIPGINVDSFYLFGFSGGGQFVHRYAAFHPDRIKRAVTGGSGWYLWPDSTIAYPVGTDMKRYNLPNIDMKEICKVKLLVLIGGKDTNRGAFRKSKNSHDLVKLQGSTRIMRAENWVKVLKQFSLKHNISCKISLKKIPGTGHTISRSFRKAAAEFLFE